MGWVLVMKMFELLETVTASSSNGTKPLEPKSTGVPIGLTGRIVAKSENVWLAVL